MAAKKRGSWRGREVYVELIARREREGLTWRQVARESRIPLATLAWWQRRLRDEDTSGRREQSFVELEPSRASHETRIEVVLLSGRRLVLPPGPPSADLLDLVRLLERPC